MKSMAMSAALAVALTIGVCVPRARAQAESKFSPEQLEQIVAPIALHPDTLLTQILMASTYPLEVVEASRWVQKNPKLAGKALEDELKQQDWDPSVKSMCGFADVLKQMNDNMDWTQDLGDAFLGQKAELLETVQKMRKKALDSGNLKTTEQQKVSQDGSIIVVESASPEVIYVPTYSPTVVYGPSWYYPTYYYPPMYVAPPPGYGAVAFTMGVVWGAAVWGDCDWHHNDVNIDIDHYNTFNKNTNINAGNTNLQNKAGDKSAWSHDPSHRKGVNYNSPQTAQKYGSASGANRVSKDAARGYGNSPTTGALGQGGASNREAGAAPSTGDIAGGARADKPAAATTGAGSSASGAFSGSRSPTLERSASTRGAASRSGGGARGGGRRG